MAQLFRRAQSLLGLGPSRLLRTSAYRASEAAQLAEEGGALSFRVFRSNYDNLPVYHDYRNGRTRNLTIVRKYSGDAEALARALARVCEQPKVEVLTGRIEIKGLHKEKVLAYFESLGF